MAPIASNDTWRRSFFKIDHRRQSQFGDIRKFGLGDL